MLVIVLTLALWNRPGSAQEETSGSPYIIRSPQGGWVMDFGDKEEQAQGADSATPVQTVEPAAPVRQVGPGVEMIIGGQGSGGVAKRGTLPVVD
jgi:hypothetical protein